MKNSSKIMLPASLIAAILLIVYAGSNIKPIDLQKKDTIYQKKDSILPDYPVHKVDSIRGLYLAQQKVR